MAGTTLGVPARAALLALMASGGEASNVELRQWLGAKGIEKKFRDLLNEEGLVASAKDGQSFSHRLTDAGWAWCATELSADPPPRSGSMGGALYAVLRGIGAHLKRSGSDLAALFGATPIEVEPAVRAAYAELADGPNDWVRLADLRPRLAGLDRAEVDRVLAQMNRLPDANLAPEPIQSILTDTDREAAVELGGRPNHLLAIDTSPSEDRA